MEKLHLQPSEIDNMPYYELEYTIEYYQEILEERNKEEEKQQRAQEDKYNVGQYNRNVNNISRNMSNFKPLTSSGGKFKMPSMPKF